MQKAMYPSKYMKITQTYFSSFSHSHSLAIDDEGLTGKEHLIAPFDCVVKRIYKDDANEVWFQSMKKVKYADGTENYMVIMLAHDNDVSDLWEGEEFKQGEKIYDRGNKGFSTGNHVHIECGVGEFYDSGWYAINNDPKKMIINNAKKPEECLWIDDSYVIINDGGFNWKNVKDDHEYDELIQQLQQRANELKEIKKELEEELEESKKEYEALKEELANMPPLPEVSESDKGKIKFRIFLNGEDD